jgi:hypothetical protein
MTRESLASLRGWLHEVSPTSGQEEHWYCVLIDHFLNLYRDETDPDPLARYPTSSMIQVAVRDSISFALRFLDGSTRIFQCDDPVERQRWFCALSSHPPPDHVTIDSFVKIRQIGQGAFGRVFLGRQISTCSRVPYHGRAQYPYACFPPILDTAILCLSNDHNVLLCPRICRRRRPSLPP